MSVVLRPPRAPRALAGLLSHLGTFLLAAGAGVVIGLQYITPNKRVIAVMVAAIMAGVAWRLDMVTGLGVMALALPFPRGTVFGSTNLAFVLLMMVLWLLRVSQSQTDPPRRSPVDAPVLSLFVAYVVSFYNISSAEDLNYAFVKMEILTACMLMMFMLVNNLNTDRDFRRFLTFQAVAATLVCLLAVWELNNPGKSFIRGWIQFGEVMGTTLGSRNLRVGSSFFDYELLSEFCALNALLALFLMARAQSTTRRVAYGALLLLIVFVLFATVTRGAMVALGVGVLFLLWHQRRRLNFVAVVSVLALLVAVFFGMDYYVSNYTRAADLLERFTQGQQFQGAVPVTRVDTWRDGWERIFEHPLIGHGPYYSPRTGTRAWFWPHCLYLYVANNVGFIGFGIFVWFLWTLFRISRPVTDDLRNGEYVESYMIIARAQLIVFLVDQIKIEFLRNDVYQFQVWVMFALIAAAHRVAHSRAPVALPAPAASPVVRP